MCWKMANGIQNQECMRKQLAVAVRSIQWSYAIFWSLSPRQGVLEWTDGYYNGDIKTRKSVQAMELKADKMGLQRSEQLRELYKSLLEGETEQQAKRPSSSLSPEDLTDAEWYYLVCMSFVFNPGQGLPGRAFANGQMIWLCDAQYADSKVFSRSLLAKSASIQTVVCFPHLGGVIELGVTDLVSEDQSLIQHVKTSLLEFSKPVCSEKSSSAPHRSDADKEPICVKVDDEIVDTMALENLYSPTEDIKFDEEAINEMQGNIDEEFNMGSPDDCSNGCEHNHQTEDSFMLEGINGGASQVQSWHLMDDDFSNCVQGSINSSDCISQAFANQEKPISSPKGKNANNTCLKELQECNDTKLSSLDIGVDDDLHYKRLVSTVLRGSGQYIESPSIRGYDYKSSFVGWKKGLVYAHRPRAQQRILKKILFTIPLMHGDCSLKSQKENGGNDWILKPESNGICMQNYMLEKRQENEKFLILRSMVPSISKIDKASILTDTIEYLKELEATVEELESFIEVDARARRKYPEVVEQTSENYDNGKVDNGKKPLLNKRKASDIDESDPELDKVAFKDGVGLDIKVTIKELEVSIDMRCPWREYLLLDIMDAMNNLQLDAHTVQSSTIDGVLTLSLKTKFRGAAVASAGKIKQTLHRIAS